MGYLLYRHKEPARAWAIYAMETDEDIESGKHEGGTGKSFFIKLATYIRKHVFIDGQKKSLSDDKHLFGRVLEDFTDLVVIDDLGKHVPLNTLFVAITGDMLVEPKFIETYNINFNKSPKIGFTSNHPLSNFDSSLRRRLWFAGFSNYYHPENSMRNLPERTMLSEFGKQLIDEYTPEEMNKMYNFLAYCLQTYLRFHKRINPPMEGIERRNLQRSMNDDFFYWAEDYFTPDRLDVEVDKQEALEAFRLSLPESDRKYAKMHTFKAKLIFFAQYKNWIFNPPHLFNSESERKRNDIRRSVEGKDFYYFYFQTK